jgi:hypothetical protein
MLIHDGGKVAADGTRLGGCQRGTPAKSATGIYTYTLQAGYALDPIEGVVIVQANAAGLVADCVHSTDTLVTVNINTDAGVDTDGIWGFVMFNLAV